MSFALLPNWETGLFMFDVRFILASYLRQHAAADMSDRATKRRWDEAEVDGDDSKASLDPAPQAGELVFPLLFFGRRT
jgi:hypothetical protein